MFSGNMARFGADMQKRPSSARKRVSASVAALICMALIASAMAGCKSIGVEDAEAAIRQELGILIGHNEAPSNPLLAAIGEGFGVDILSVSQSDDESFTAECVLSNHDVAAALAAVETTEPGMTLSEFAEALSQAFATQPRLEREAEIAIELLDDGTCRAVLTEDQLDAATGGLVSLYGQMVGSAE